uniref:Transmembrane protein n=1 Tax=Medicago truncatula TaxID=3880 RepID=I3TA11_MEDTR|nr:unknown [Medicago truncatula]
MTIAGLIVTISMLFSLTNFQAASSANVFETTYHRFDLAQKSASVNQVSSTTTSGVRGFPL